MFLIDANCLIAPFNKYYAFDLVPQFWVWMEEKVIDGKIVILDKIYGELYNVTREDELSRWIKRLAPYMMKHEDQAIIVNYGVVLQYVETSGHYTQRALNEWSNEKVADPWLIACAITHKCTIVTFEQPDNKTQNNWKSKNPKIPDVGQFFGVEVVDLFEMMRSLGFKSSR